MQATTDLQARSQTQPSLIEKLAAPDLTMLLATLIRGGNFAVIKTALAQIGPLPFTAVRFILATLMLTVLLK